MASGSSAAGDDITLRDVVNHIQAVKHELKSEMNQMEQRLSTAISENTRGIDQNSQDIRNLTHRIDTLESDLHVTIKEMLVIRRHVGMGIAEDD